MEFPHSPISRLLLNVDENTLNRALLQSTEVSCAKGEVIYSPHTFQRSLALLLEGRIQVSKDALVVSTLQAGDIFGAAALFNDCEDYAGTLTALTDCRMLFMPQPAVLTLLTESPAFAENYVRYLSGRIRFLSSRLDALSAGSAAGRLAHYLLQGRSSTLTLSATALCRRLGLSRASLYRAFETLENAGAIRRAGKQIQILDPEKLQGSL